MLGAGLPRILGYYQEDGAKSIVQIEQAMAAGNASAMVIPAHTLKGESRQFGAARMGDIAEAIEKTARWCIEHHSAPDEVAAEVAMLRGCFAETLLALGTSTPPIPGHPLHAGHSSSSTLRALSPARAPRTFGRRPTV
jgi:HPt (histidine-containing phosphotransfer) domain-containing protein